MTKVLKQPVCRSVAGFASMITVLILRGTDAGKYVEGAREAAILSIATLDHFSF